jgi:hypothetical protein
MSREEIAPPSDEEAAVRNYILICVAALFLILVSDQGDLGGALTLLPVLAGALGLIMRTSMGSIMLLLTLGAKIFLVHLMRPSWVRVSRFEQAAFRLTDILLGLGVLAYVIAHYRLVGLVRNIFPLDPRRRELVPRPDRRGMVSRQVEERRSKRLVEPLEFALMLVALPVFTLLAHVVWKLLRLPARWSGVDLPDWLWPWTGLIWPVWMLAMVLLATWGLISYWARRGMSATEGQIILQDAMWEETRREQRWINRWLAWDRRQRRRKENKS